MMENHFWKIWQLVGYLLKFKTFLEGPSFQFHFRVGHISFYALPDLNFFSVRLHYLGYSIASNHCSLCWYDCYVWHFQITFIVVFIVVKV